jgi:hypothetical protein
MKPSVIASVLILGGLLAWVIVSMRGQSKIACELCIEFGGRSVCRGAAGATRKDAVSAATTSACATLAAGMTEIVTCERTPPTKLDCR